MWTPLKSTYIRSLISLVVIICFLVSGWSLPLVQAEDFHLPQPGVMVHLSPPLEPPILKGIKVYPENPFQFDFILDQGDTPVQQEQAKTEALKLIKYFLAGLTIPETDLWVNLSPYEKDRMIPQSFGLTEMGRDLLAEDYMLKQITASLIYPEDNVGKMFWKRVYEEAAKRYGTTNVPVNTFNKVWIVPETAVVYENAQVGTAYVVESKLKVMLEQDYLALEKNQMQKGDRYILKDKNVPVTFLQNTSALGSQIVREIVIPELTREVNENKNFARLRQVYNSLILAAWYKKKIRSSILAQVYEDKNKVAGVNIDDPKENEKIYQRYLLAFKKGVCNYIKEDLDPATQEMIPRKYFSGGMDFAMRGEGNTRMGLGSLLQTAQDDQRTEDAINAENNPLRIKIMVQPPAGDFSMLGKTETTKINRPQTAEASLLHQQDMIGFVGDLKNYVNGSGQMDHQEMEGIVGDLLQMGDGILPYLIDALEGESGYELVERAWFLNNKYINWKDKEFEYLTANVLIRRGNASLGFINTAIKQSSGRALKEALNGDVDTALYMVGKRIDPRNEFLVGVLSRIGTPQAVEILKGMNRLTPALMTAYGDLGIKERLDEMRKVLQTALDMKLMRELRFKWNFKEIKAAVYALARLGGRSDHELIVKLLNQTTDTYYLSQLADSITNVKSDAFHQYFTDRSDPDSPDVQEGLLLYGKYDVREEAKGGLNADLFFSSGLFVQHPEWLAAIAQNTPVKNIKKAAILTLFTLNAQGMKVMPLVTKALFGKTSSEFTQGEELPALIDSDSVADWITQASIDDVPILKLLIRQSSGDPKIMAYLRLSSLDKEAASGLSDLLGLQPEAVQKLNDLLVPQPDAALDDMLGSLIKFRDENNIGLSRLIDLSHPDNRDKLWDRFIERIGVSGVDINVQVPWKSLRSFAERHKSLSRNFFEEARGAEVDSRFRDILFSEIALGHDHDYQTRIAALSELIPRDGSIFYSMNIDIYNQLMEETKTYDSRYGDRVEWQRLRSLGVSLLPKLDGYAANERVLSDKNEDTVVRQQAKLNLDKFELEIKTRLSNTPSDRFIRSFMLQRQMRALARSRENNQDIPDHPVATVLHVQNVLPLKQPAAILPEAPLPAPLPAQIRSDLIEDHLAPTPLGPDNRTNVFVDVLVKTTDRTRRQIEQEVQAHILKEHTKLLYRNGFIQRGESVTGDKIFGIYDNLVKGYNRLAALSGLAPIKGKLFLVESPTVNAWVFEGHQDVYITTGLINEIAHYCRMKGISMTEDIIAFVLAHEMRHIMQKTAFEGISFGDLSQNKALKQEILQLKRQAEHDADANGGMIMGLSGYNPQASFLMLEFLRDMTYETVGESVFQDHPHPKDRVLYLQQIFNSDRGIPGMILPMKNLGIDEFLNWNHKHLGLQAENVHSRQDALAVIGDAKNINQVLEGLRLVRLAGAYQIPIAVSRQQAVEDDLAREVFVSNVLDTISALAGGRLIPTEPITSLPLSGSQGVLGRWLNRDENIAVPELSAADMQPFSQERSIERANQMLNSGISKIKDSISVSDMPLDVKVNVLDQIRMFHDAALRYLNERFNQTQFYDHFINQASLNNEQWERSVTRARSATDAIAVEAVVDGLAQQPFAIYRLYGQKSLDQQMALRDLTRANAGGVARQLGLDSNDIELGEVVLERSNSGFYEKDITTWPTDTPQERRKLIEALSLDHVFSASGQANNLLQNKNSTKIDEPEGFTAVLGTTIDLLLADPKTLEWLVSHGINAEEVPQFRQWLQLYFILKTNKNWTVADAARKKLYINISQETDRYLPVLAQWSGAEQGQIFSDIFVSEMPAASGMSKDALIDDNRSLDKQLYMFELEDKPDDAVNVFVHQLERLNPSSMQERQDLFIDFLKKFSFLFRKQVLLSMVVDQKDFMTSTFAPMQLRDRLKGLMFDADIYGFVWSLTNDILPKNITTVAKTDEEMANLSQACDWLIKNRPADRFLDTDFFNGYVNLKLISLWRQKLADRKTELDAMNEKELADAIGQVITPEEAFEILSKIAAEGLWQIDKIAPYSTKYDAPQDRFVLGQMSKSRYEELSAEAQALGKEKTLTLEAHQVPVSLFETEKENVVDAVMKQWLFRRIFDFNIDQLETIAQGQNAVSANNRFRRGRAEGVSSINDINKMLDKLLILKSLEQQGSPQKISSQSFGEIWDWHCDIGKVDSHGNFDPKIATMTPSLKPVDNLLALQVGSVLRLNLSDAQTRQKAGDLFEQLKKIGVLGGYEEMDRFAEELSKTPIGLEMFYYYADWMTEPQIPSLQQKALEPSQTRRPYLDAMVEAVDLEGVKARIFKHYNDQVNDMLSSEVSLDKKLQFLRFFLKKPTLFRDGFLDSWERALVPQIDLSASEKIGLFIARQRAAGRLKDRYAMFETMFVMTPLQWEKINAKDNKGNEIPLGISQGRVDEILDFYRKTIPLVADPQRQLRMGATALKIYREANPNRRFQEELEAIQGFFPLASEIRDSYINELLERYEVGSDQDLEGIINKKQLDEIRRLYSIHQNVQYDEELTNANYALQMMKALLSAASREDRVGLLFWVLDSKNFPEPGLIQQLADKFNLDFSDLPLHVSILPEQYRVKILENLFLGENGLFSPQSEKDELLMSKFADTLFNHFFKKPGTRDKFGEALDEQTYGIVQDVFKVVLKEYSPSRRSSLVMGLLKDQQKLSRMNDGEKLAVLLAALGPVGVKLGQILSENKTIIRDPRLRSNLASLKSNAPAVSKFSILEMLEQAGIDINNVRLGKRLAAASMGQVYEGWYRVDGQWKEVVIKALRPNLERSVDEDFHVFDKALEFIKQKYGKDAQYLVEPVKQWITIEKDFRNEAANFKIIEGTVARFKAEHPGLAVDIQVPKIFVGDKPWVLIEERARGVEGGKIMDGRVPNPKVTPATIVEELRQLFLYMIFQDGHFHADLHSDNIMVDEGISLIDLGFIGYFNESQREAAKEFMHGVILQNQEMVINGIKGIIAQSDNVAVGSRDRTAQNIEDQRSVLNGEIGALFNRGLDIKHEMNELLTIVTSKRFEGVQAYADFMKALTTAIWLFPTDILSANKTLDALALAVNLPEEQKFQAKKLRAWSLVKHEVGAKLVSMAKAPRLANLKQRGQLMINKAALNLKRVGLGRSVLTKTADLQNRIQSVINSRRQIIELNEKEVARPSYELVAEMDVMNKGALGDIRPDIQNDVLKNVADKLGFNERQRQILREAVSVYFKIQHLFRTDKFNNMVRASVQEGWIISGVILPSAVASMEQGLLARGLTAKILRWQILQRQQNLSPEEITAIEQILPTSLVERKVSREMAESFLLTLDRKGPQLAQIMNLPDDLSFNFYNSNDKEVKLVIYDIPQEPGDVKVSVKKQELIDAESINKELLKAISKIKDQLVPGHWQGAGAPQSNIEARLTRTGFSKQARILVDLFDKADQRLISLSLSQEQFVKFINGSGNYKADVSQYYRQSQLAENGRQDEWLTEAVSRQPQPASRYYRPQDTFPRKSKSLKAGSFDFALTAQKGGIDLTPANMHLQVQNSGGTIKFNLNPEQIAQLQNAPGFEPVIIDIQPMTNLRLFLGLEKS